MSEVGIEVEDDPVPIVRVFASRFRRSVKNAAFVDALRGIDKPFAIASNKDPQALTIDARDGRIRLSRGISRDVAIVIRMDFDGDDPPDVEGLWRHPLLAMRVGKLMELPAPGWREVAVEFWAKWRDHPRMPKGIALHDAASGDELVLGEAPAEVELYADGKTLAEILGGETILLQAFMQGKVKGLCGLEHAAVLSEVTKDMMLDNA